MVVKYQVFCTWGAEFENRSYSGRGSSSGHVNHQNNFRCIIYSYCSASTTEETISFGDIAIFVAFNTSTVLLKTCSLPAPSPVFNNCTTRKQSPSFIRRSTAKSLLKTMKFFYYNNYTSYIIPIDRFRNVEH